MAPVLFECATSTISCSHESAWELFVQFPVLPITISAPVPNLSQSDFLRCTLSIEGSPLRHPPR